MFRLVGDQCGLKVIHVLDECGLKVDIAVMGKNDDRPKNISKFPTKQGLAVVYCSDTLVRLNKLRQIAHITDHAEE